MNTARPTEYEGVRFKSKSEAIFARNLTLAGFIWEYEPLYFGTNDGWVPDFWVVHQSYKRGHKLHSTLIEYKPADVTKTYLEELWRRLDSLGERLSFQSAGVAIGSPFDAAITRQFLVRFSGEWVDIEDGVGLFSHIEEARTYRYDLV